MVIEGGGNTCSWAMYDGHNKVTHNPTALLASRSGIAGWPSACDGSQITFDLSRDKTKEVDHERGRTCLYGARGLCRSRVANFRPSPEAQERVAELLDRQRDSTLTEQEAAELDGFVQFEHILGLAKAKAQLILANRY